MDPCRDHSLPITTPRTGTTTRFGPLVNQSAVADGTIGGPGKLRCREHEDVEAMRVWSPAAAARHFAIR
jgi:hypothetical protein